MTNVSTVSLASRVALTLALVFQIRASATAQSPQPSSLSQSPGQIAKRAFPSVVLLLMSDRAGQPISLGSGFFVRPNIVATNLHVVQGAVSGQAKLVGNEVKHNVLGVIASDSSRDLALVQVDGAIAPTLPLGHIEDVVVGDSVYAVGNPYGLEGTISEGIISGIRNLGQDKLFQITAPISPGSSGGPVLNAKGAVVGLAVASIAAGQNLNFAIPASYLAGLLQAADVGKLKPLSAFTEGAGQPAWRELGAPATDAVIATHVGWNGSYGISYAFTLRNQLDKPIKVLYCLVVFRDGSGDPVDTAFLTLNKTIPARLAKRFGNYMPGSISPGLAPTIEVRVLDFRIGE